MTAVGARNRGKNYSENTKKVKFNTLVLFLKRPLEILLKSAIRISESENPQSAKISRIRNL